MRRMRRLSIAAAILAVSALVWLARVSDDWRTSFSFSGKDANYYNLLVHGFQQGHLYMDCTPDPALWSTDPDIRRRASYVQDASLYNHRYYLYYGVVPAAVLLLPYSSITGGDLSANVATLAFTLAGFLFSLRAYRRAQREYFAGIGAMLDSLNILLLGFASLGPLLVKCSGVYEIAVASGYACSAAAIYFLYRSLHSAAGGLSWLAGASLFLGLSVGCRPNYILSFPILVAGGWLIMSGKLLAPAQSGSQGMRRSLTACILAACLPAAAIVALLATYNYARFGNPMEFGFHYGMNAFTGSGRPIASTSFMWPNFRWYYLTPPVVTPYFPYCFSINAAALPPGYFSPEAIHGQWIVGVLFVVSLCGAAGASIFGISPSRALRAFLAMLVWMGISGLVFMISLGVRADRYMTDFQAPLVLLTVLLAGLTASKAVRRSAVSVLWRTSYGIVACAAILFNFFISLEIFNNFEYLHPKTFERLAALGDLPICELGEHGFVDFGPVRFKVVFPPPQNGISGPLMATGTPNKTDVLYVTQFPQGSMELSMVHEGQVGLRSGMLPFVAGRPYTFEVDMGSLYPPRVSPYFSGWDKKDVDRLKTNARVLIDGKEVIRGRVVFYESAPGHVHFGANPDEGDARFLGRITDIRRLPAREAKGIPEPGIWRIDITVPWLAPYVAHPLLGSGVTGAGNLLIVDVPKPNQIRFALDQWGGQMTRSRALDVLPGGHRIEVFVGPQVARQKWPAAWHLNAESMKKSGSMMNVWWDGALVWTTEIVVNRESYDLVSLGSNPQGFSTADMMFPSEIEFKPYSRDEMRNFILRNLGYTQ